MTGARLLDRDRAENRAESRAENRAQNRAQNRADGRAGYRDPLGLVSEGRPAGRLRKVLAVAAVCGAGLMAGLGLFGGSAPKPAKPATSVGIMKAADSIGTRPDTRHSPLNHKPHAHRPVKRPPHSTGPTPPRRGTPSAPSTHTARSTRSTQSTHKGSAGTGAPHGTVRHSPAHGENPPLRRPASPPATVPHEGPAATAHRAPPPSSPRTVPAASR